jgi:hypothetical protein
MLLGKLGLEIFGSAEQVGGHECTRMNSNEKGNVGLAASVKGFASGHGGKIGPQINANERE